MTEKKSEMEIIIDNAEKLRKQFKLNKQEALLLMAVHEISAIHYHIDCTVIGMAQAHGFKQHT
jgi:hypothetical protein